MHEFLVVNKNDNVGGFTPALRDVGESLQPLTLIGRRLLQGHGLCHNFIQHAGRHTPSTAYPYESSARLASHGHKRYQHMAYRKASAHCGCTCRWSCRPFELHPHLFTAMTIPLSLSCANPRCFVSSSRPRSMAAAPRLPLKRYGRCSVPSCLLILLFAAQTYHIDKYILTTVGLRPYDQRVVPRNMQKRSAASLRDIDEKIFQRRLSDE